MHTKTQKIISLLVGIFIFCLAISSVSFSAVRAQERTGRKQLFLVTAYYSPLPGQSSYFRGSYEADIKFNGNGTNGADGTPVYPGMLAAPKSYAFGTQIDIPGLGLGVVHDRGGRILENENYDRIDVWMGKGEEGLARALQWGARKVEGIIYETPTSEGPNLDYTDIPADYSILSSLQKTFTRKTLSTGDTGDEVRDLQNKLKELGFFDGPATGNFGPLTENAVFEFQRVHNILSLPSDWGAGVFGPKTRSALESKSTVPVPHDDDMSLATSTSSIFRLQEDIGKDAFGQDVARLQRILRSLGYYSGDITEKYDTNTIHAVLTFQIDEGILENETDMGAGYFGHKTYSHLSEVLEERKIKRQSFEEQKTTQVFHTADGEYLMEVHEFVFGENLQAM